MRSSDPKGQLLATIAWVVLVSCAAGCSDVDEFVPAAIDPGDEIIAWHINAIISGNHGHKAVLHIVQVERGEPVTLPVYGAPHTHTVDLNHKQLARVGEGNRVNTRSSIDDGHDHWMEFYAPYLADDQTP